MADNKKPWTTDEYYYAMRMRADGFTYPQIAKRLGRTLPSVSDRLRLSIDRSQKFDQQFRIEVPEYVLREREERYSAPYRNATAELMGDPLPGQSALDRRAQKEAA